MKNIYDISVEISTQSIVWPGDPKIHLDRVSDMNKGAEYNLTYLEMSLHTGSHIDAPLHYYREGKSTDQIPLDALIGPCFVLEIESSVDLVNASLLANLKVPDNLTRLLLKTRNSTFWKETSQEFHQEYCGVTNDGAKFLIERGIQLVGIDYLSISPLIDLDAPHLELLKNNVVVLETINLSGIEPGWYELFCLPLRITGVEGVPVRAILIK